jgi:DNA-directed RNA polymerase subunit M/transcription elongation factor TFIIS
MSAAHQIEVWNSVSLVFLRLSFTSLDFISNFLSVCKIISRAFKYHQSTCFFYTIMQKYSSTITNKVHCIKLRVRPDTSARIIKTVSQPTAFPSSLRQRLRSDVQTVSTDDDPRKKDAVIQEKCEKCGREEVRYYTQQLRSADEGSTVFYHCECGHK